MILYNISSDSNEGSDCSDSGDSSRGKKKLMKKKKNGDDKEFLWTFVGDKKIQMTTIFQWK